MKPGELKKQFTRRDWQRADPPGDPFRIAAIGLGWFSREHALPALEESDFCTLSLGVDPGEKNRTEVSQTRNVPAISPEAFHEGSHVDVYDAVYVAAPNSYHLNYTETAARLGKQVLCEKPMEKTLDRSRAMVEAAKTEDITLMIAYRMQSEPAIRRMKEWLQDGLIGDPEIVHSSVSQQLLSIDDNPDQWRLDRELSGGGAMINLGLYPLNTTRFLLDENPEDVKAHADSSHPAFSEVEEKVTFQLTFPSGAVSCGSAQETAHRASHLSVVGERGRFHLQPAYAPWKDLTLTIETESMKTTITRTGINQLTEQFDYFGHSLQTSSDPHPSGEHALVDMEVVNEIYRMTSF